MLFPLIRVKNRETNNHSNKGIEQDFPSIFYESSQRCPQLNETLRRLNPETKKNNKGSRQIICLFFWWRWKSFHVLMNCQKWKNNWVNEKDNSNSDRTVGSKSHRCCHRVCCPFRSSLVTYLRWLIRDTSIFSPQVSNLRWRNLRSRLINSDEHACFM